MVGYIMTFIGKVKKALSEGKFCEESVDFLEDFLNALLGNPVSAGKVMLSLAKHPFFVREHIFWKKMERFLDGVFLSDEDQAKFCAKLNEGGKKEENATRLLSYIEKAETNHKIDYIINTTRNFIIGNIDNAIYFRICYTTVNNIDEDLKFLADNIDNKKMEVSIHTNGLFISGLMYQSDIDSSGCNNRYSFTELARVLDMYSLSYSDVAKYPNPGIYTLPSVIEQETEIQSDLNFVKTFEDAKDGYA